MGILRFILSIAVVFSHAGSFLNFDMMQGQIAVQAFYIISGFYMAIILSEKYIDNNTSYGLFLSNRFLRLFPIYWVVLLLTVIISIFFHGSVNTLQFYENHQLSIFSCLFLIVSQLIIIGQDALLFLGLDPEGVFFFTSNFRETDPRLHQFLFVPQAWTISLEIMFYLIAPFLVKKTAKFLVVIFVLSVLAKMFLMNKGFSFDPWTHRFFPFELAFFVLGILSYKWKIWINLHKKVDDKIVLLLWILIIIFSIGYRYIAVDKLTRELLLFTLIAFSLPTLFDYFKSNSIDRWIGELSYPIYISHILMIRILNNILGLSGHPWYSFIVLMITVIFSIITLIFIANPIDKIRQKRIIIKGNV